MRFGTPSTHTSQGNINHMHRFFFKSDVKKIIRHHIENVPDVNVVFNTVV